MGGGIYNKGKREKRLKRKGKRKKEENLFCICLFWLPQESVIFFVQRGRGRKKEGIFVVSASFGSHMKIS